MRVAEPDGVSDRWIRMERGIRGLGMRRMRMGLLVIMKSKSWGCILRRREFMGEVGMGVLRLDYRGMGLKIWEEGGVGAVMRRRILGVLTEGWMRGMMRKWGGVILLGMERRGVTLGV